ncbi:hypothetical protein OESDEN_16237 [Oesophagostomum dentatum]|uniref:Uncharacterized protein n=1 Tax=Oesophagostomum dentatum TaxID=61180 RepID=A0A0B1SFF5_OESDE|nr:hypothetical protein OESDEN_16237 [Oesophagostomum dentatum]
MEHLTSIKTKPELGEHAAARYAGSIFGCLALGSNSKDALGLGTMWGTERAKKLLKEAGFDDVKLIPTPHFEENICMSVRNDAPRLF